MRVFGEYDGVFANDLPRPRSLDRVLELYEKEVDFYSNEEIDYAVMIKFRSVMDDMNNQIEKCSNLDQLNRTRDNCLKQAYNILGMNFELEKLQDYNDEAFFLSLIADNLEERDRLFVDSGCGPGIEVNILAKLFPDKKFIANDISRIQLGLARDRMDRSGNENIEFYSKSMEKMKLDPESVDVSMCKEGTMYGLELLANNDKEYQALILESTKESRRSVRRNGKYISYHKMHPGSPVSKNLPGLSYLSSVFFADEDFQSSGKSFKAAFLCSPR